MNDEIGGTLRLGERDEAFSYPAESASPRGGGKER